MEVSRCIDLKDKIGACVVRELYNLRARGDESCDFELSSLDDTSYKVHSLLLSAVWKSFRSWRSGHHQDNKLTFAGVSGTELRLVVLFLYGWCSKIESENKSLQKALSQLGIDVLQEVHNEFMTNTTWTSTTYNKKSQPNPPHKQNEKNTIPVDVVVKKELFDYEISNDNIGHRALSNLHLDPDESKTNVNNKEFLNDIISDDGNLHIIHQTNDTIVNSSAFEILKNQTNGSCKVSSEISPEHLSNDKSSKDLQYQPSPKKKKYCDTKANQCKEIKANLKTPRPIKPKICTSVASSTTNLHVPISSKINKCSPSILRKSFGIYSNQNMTKLDTCTTIVSTNITRPTVTGMTALPNTNNIISTQCVSTPSYCKSSNDNITYTQNQQKLCFSSTPLCITKANLINTNASGGTLTSPVTLSIAPSPSSSLTKQMHTISQVPQIGTMHSISEVPQLCTMQNINVPQGQCNLATIHPYNVNPKTANSVLVGPSGFSLNAPRVPFKTIRASTVIGLPVQPPNSGFSITKGPVPINTNPIFLPNNVPSSTIKFSPVPVQLIPVNTQTFTSTANTNAKSITATSHLVNNLKYLTSSSDMQSIPVNNNMNILSTATPFQKVDKPIVTTVTNISPVSDFSGDKIPVVTQTASIPQVVNIRSKSEKCAAININSCKIRQQSEVPPGIFNHPIIKNHSISFDLPRSKVRMVLPKFSSKSPRNGSSYTEIQQTKKHLELTPTKEIFVATGIEESNRSTLMKPTSMRSTRRHNPSSCETTSSPGFDVCKKSLDIGQSVRPQIPLEDVKPSKEQSLDNDVFIIEEKIGAVCASVKSIPVDKQFNEVVTKHLDFSSEGYEHDSTDKLLRVLPSTKIQERHSQHSKVAITQKKLTDDEHNDCKQIQNNPCTTTRPKVLDEEFSDKIAEYKVSTGESEQSGDFKDISDFMSHFDDVVIVNSSPEIATKAIKSELTESGSRTPSFKSAGVVLAASSKPNEVTMSMVLPRDVEIVKRFMNDQSP